MTSTQFSYSSARLRRVKYLQFGVFSPEEIKAMSVTKQTKVNDKIIPDGVTRPDSDLMDDAARVRAAAEVDRLEVKRMLQRGAPRTMRSEDGSVR